MVPKKIGILVFAAGVAALGGCSDLGNPVRPQAKAVLSAASLDFGTVAVSANATRSVTLTNSGTAVLSGSATISCAEYQLISGGGPFSITPGESRDIVIQFAPGAVGSFPCTLNHGPNVPQISVLGVGAVQLPGAQCAVLPDAIDFGYAPVGQAGADSFRIFRNPATTFNNLLTLGYIVPFDTAGSDLYNRITGVYSPMPQGGPLIPLSERDKFRDWILEGATGN